MTADAVLGLERIGILKGFLITLKKDLTVGAP